MRSFDWSSFLTSQFWSLPYLVVYLAGMVLAVIFWRRHPMVSLLAMGGFCILTGNIVIAIGLQFWAMTTETVDVGTVFRIAAAFRSVLGALGFALLTGAIFGWRSAVYVPEEYR